MIDKLEIRIPASTPVSRELGPFWEALRRGVSVPGFRPSQHYRAVGDLRPYGIHAIAHLECRHGNASNHKLELLDTGKVGFSVLLDRIEQTFSLDPLSAEVMRVDLAADIEGVPVSLFENAVYVAYKRWVCDIGTVECSRMGGRAVETLYLGKRPNCIRIYNKTEEYRQQYRALARELGSRACALPFEKIFQISESTVLTRVERQIGAGRVPPNLETIARLQENAADFNPFAKLQVHAGSKPLPRPEDAGLSVWLQGMALRAIAMRDGKQRLRRLLNAHSNGNTARILNQYADFLPGPGKVAISNELLYSVYRTSVERQLAA